MASRAWRELLSPPPGVEKVVLDRAQALNLLRHIERLESRVSRQEQESQDLRGAQQQLREKLKAMEEARTSEEKRKDPPPSFVKPNVKKAGTPKKRGAKKGHEAHHRPPPPDDLETVEATLRERWCACGKELGEPFDWDDRTIEEVVKGHVRRRHCKVARYRCSCGRLIRAKVPSHWAPRKSRFSWGIHFLAAAWHAMGFPVSRLQMLFETDYGLKVSTGEIDKMLARASRLFAPALEAIQKAVREGKTPGKRVVNLRAPSRRVASGPRRLSRPMGPLHGRACGEDWAPASGAGFWERTGTGPGTRKGGWIRSPPTSEARPYRCRPAAGDKEKGGR